MPSRLRLSLLFALSLCLGACSVAERPSPYIHQFAPGTKSNVVASDSFGSLMSHADKPAREARARLQNSRQTPPITTQTNAEPTQ